MDVSSNAGAALTRRIALLRSHIDGYEQVSSSIGP